MPALLEACNGVHQGLRRCYMTVFRERMCTTYRVVRWQVVHPTFLESSRFSVLPSRAMSGDNRWSWTKGTRKPVEERRLDHTDTVERSLAASSAFLRRAIAGVLVATAVPAEPRQGFRASPLPNISAGSRRSAYPHPRVGSTYHLLGLFLFAAGPPPRPGRAAGGCSARSMPVRIQRAAPRPRPRPGD